MSERLRRGFKANAERIAAEVRKDLGLSCVAPIDCIKLCSELGIPIISVPDLVTSGASAKSIRQILAPASKFSAMTIGVGTRRLIVYNPYHPKTRRANSLAHELSHILLEHPLLPALGVGGCRHWDAVLEAEADWQAAALLVPREAALCWMQAGGSVEDGASHFGVSIPLFRWRVNQTGIPRQLAALTAFRTH
jgi:Zn-dependent peptidase ImmA (M78 family)